jgi:hypothetical protein
MRTTLGALALLLTVVASGQPAASGAVFQLEVGPPVAGSSSLAKDKKTALVVRPLRCAPASVTITGTAEGIVNGTRHSIPLKLVALETPGVYAVPRVWEQGRWVLTLSGACAERNGEVAATIVPLAPGGFVRDAIKMLTRPATPGEVDAALRDTRVITS